MFRPLTLRQPDNLSSRNLLVAKKVLVVMALCMLCKTAVTQLPPTHDPAEFGPYNGRFLADGLGLKEPIANTHDSVLRADSPWTMYCWFKTTGPVAVRELVAGLGETSSEYPRYLALDASHATLWMGKGNEISAPTALSPDTWHLLAATFDGAVFTLYADANTVGSGKLLLGSASPLLQIAPPVVVADAGTHFGGDIASFTLLRRALTASEIQHIARTRPEFSMMAFEDASKPWPIQTRAQAGYRAPQEPAMMPASRAPFPAPVAIKRPPHGPSLVSTGAGEWTFNDGWQLREAPKVQADAAQISSASYDAATWMRATVPGTVLTTMVDDGVYPDPDYGLNNMAIPESLNRQDYWYRNEFIAPEESVAGKDRHVILSFEGINYEAAVWLNGKPLGSIKGAFTRGSFDVGSALHTGKNVIAVRISPPPHPGIPQEQSVLGGPGENGGAMELDGPTFLATEGWDWIPAIRDRNSGIWQPVTLKVTGGLRIGDAQVISSFPNHDTAHAALEVAVPIVNESAQTIRATLSATLEQIKVTKTLDLPPGESIIKLAPDEYAQLTVDHPRLWWPNGYGAPELYHLKLDVTPDGSAAPSDRKDVRFGIREISYELSLMDATGHLRRVEYFPTTARNEAGPSVDVTHAGMLEIPSADAIALNLPEDKRDHYPYQSHVSSIAKGMESSPSLRSIPDGGPAPYLVIKVNGVRIAVRGGAWGMDDSRKRVSRAHLEPFFRLDREANLNTIRNWVGQDTEETFFELADEYGMLVWNDFWESTQNYNIEAEDPQLFLANAADTIKRFRNHPSIVLWCGRNEGVPQPILNTGLDKLTRTLDGTRFYSPSSNQVNLQDSGPYSYQVPSLYFNQLNRGFSVETGTPSMSTLESFKSTTPEADRWPIGDAWAYHDWHQSGNGDVNSFMAEIENEFGAAASLEDFERKAQMLNYVDHRAIFEGMNANLWTPNSGRMLWMTQPAWPSTMWQILSSDYDTQASFYAVKKACEPIHIQLNLATYGVDIINLTRTDQTSLTVSAKVYSLANALLFSGSESKNVAANSKSASLQLNLAPYLHNGMVIVQLELHGATGNLLSQNLYWLGERSSSYRELTRLASTPIQVHATSRTDGATTRVHVELTNSGSVVSLANKLTLFNAKTHLRTLPAYFSDNYLSLLPGQSETVDIEIPAGPSSGGLELSLRGWNAETQLLPVK
jgi:hypothetical protein